MDETFEATWARFLAAPLTLGPSPGVREAWHRGRERYAVWVLRVRSPDVLERLAFVADRLTPHGVRPFFEPHVTLFVVGFPTPRPVHDDDVALPLLGAQVDALRAADLPSPRLTVGGVNAFLSCPILEIHDPHGDLTRIRAPLTREHGELRYAPYQPHLTIGPFGDTRPTGPVAEAIAPLRRLPPLPLPVEAVELVTFDAAVSDGALSTVERVPLRR